MRSVLDALHYHALDRRSGPHSPPAPSTNDASRCAGPSDALPVCAFPGSFDVQQFVASREILQAVTDRRGDPEHEAPQGRTQTDAVGPEVWLGDDAIVQLRQWGTDNAHPIPDVPELVIGADPAVDLPLVDPKRSLSRRHARLVREEGRWVLEDTQSRNGVRCDGVRAPGKRFLLMPGMEIGLGSLTLIVENATLIGLRAYLARILGWEAQVRPTIDLAMRAVRATANRRAPLVLSGTDDLVAVARQIHCRTMPPKTAFVVCGKPRESDASVRVTTTLANTSAALERADGGTICIRADRLPARYDELVEATSAPYATAQLFVCATKTAKRWDPVTPPIVVPELARRTEVDVRRIVSEYAHDAMSELGAGSTAFTEKERDWVVKHETSAFADIEIATLRIVARNVAGNVHQAAPRLGLSHVALGKWFKRRGLRTTA